MISASNLSFRVVDFVNLKNPDNPSVKGWNADPLLPDVSANAEKGKNLPFYVMVKVPKEQKARDLPRNGAGHERDNGSWQMFR